MNAYMTLISFANRTSPSEIYCKVAQKILLNLDRVKNASICELAALCYVSTATISRFCKKIGYDSYSVFKSELSLAVSEFNHNSCYVCADTMEDYAANESDFFLSIINRYSESLKELILDEQLHEIARSLYHHKCVGLFSSVLSYQLYYLQADLLLTKHEVRFYQTPSEQLNYAKSLSGDSIAVILKPEHGEARYIDDIMAILKKKDVKVILISNTRRSQANKMADYNLSFNGNRHIVDAFCFDMLISLLSMEYRRMYLKV